MNGRLINLPCVVPLLLIALISCVSARETCEWYETPGEWEGLCILTSYSMVSCPDKIASGTATVEQCNQRTDLALLTCAKYLDARSKCSKESDLPIVPKIVNRQIKPDVADFIRWQMARSQGKAVTDQPAI